MPGRASRFSPHLTGSRFLQANWYRVCEETAMSTDKNTKIEIKPETATPYRPLGLKAVAAAAMMLNSKTKLTPAR
jgi:hypothetical protein